MSFYRSILAAALAVALVSPVFADDTTTGTTTGTDTNATATTTTTGDTASTTNATEQTTKINLNKATVKELKKMGLKGKEANKIVAYRHKHGNFKSVDDLANVKGLKLSPETMQNLQNQLIVE